MKKFEYDNNDRYKQEDMSRGSFKEAEYLTKRGCGGWELVGVVRELGGDATRYYWKREISE